MERGRKLVELALKTSLPVPDKNIDENVESPCPSIEGDPEKVRELLDAISYDDDSCEDVIPDSPNCSRIIISMPKKFIKHCDTLNAVRYSESPSPNNIHDDSAVIKRNPNIQSIVVSSPEVTSTPPHSSDVHVSVSKKDNLDLDIWESDSIDKNIPNSLTSTPTNKLVPRIRTNHIDNDLTSPGYFETAPNSNLSVQSSIVKRYLDIQSVDLPSNISSISPSSYHLINSPVAEYDEVDSNDIYKNNQDPKNVLSVASYDVSSVNSNCDLLLIVNDNPTPQSRDLRCQKSSTSDADDFDPASDSDPTYSPSPRQSQKSYILDDRTGTFRPIANESDSEDMSDELDTESDHETANKGRPKRGRKRKHPECNRETNKRNRNSNKSFYNYKGDLKLPREFIDSKCKCTKKCHENISLSSRKKEFKRFWELGSYNAQNAYLASKITEKPIERSRATTSKKKSFSREYILNHRVVCKEIFKNTYHVSSCRINTALKKVNDRSNLLDGRGKPQGGRNKISEERRQQVIDFIKKIPTYKSHYRRAEVESKFLPSNVTLSKLIELYKEEFKENAVSDSTFKRVFYEEFNLRTAPLKKDTCNYCDKMATLIANEKNPNKLEELNLSRNIHLERAENAQKQMKADLNLAQESDAIECITFDMEKTLPMPRIPTNIVFYKRQLWLYNQGIYSGKFKQGFCYVWVEGEAGKGAQEIGSCIIRHLKEELPNSVRKLILWSDSCGGQNRNIKITLMLKAILEVHPNLEEVTFKFLYSGHSFLPNDRDFSCIESALKHQQRLYTPDDYIEVMRNSKKVKPLKVKRMQKDEFFGTELLEKHIVNRKIGIDKSKVNWMNIREISLNEQEKYKLKVKESHDIDDAVIQIDLKPTTFRSRPNADTFYELFIPLWPNGKPISTAKLKDIESMMDLIPENCHLFYVNLKTDNSIEDDIEGFDVPNLDFEISED